MLIMHARAQQRRPAALHVQQWQYAYCMVPAGAAAPAQAACRGACAPGWAPESLRCPLADAAGRRWRHDVHGVLNAREWAGARVPYRWGCPPGTPHNGGLRASQGRNSTAWGGHRVPLRAGATRSRKCPEQGPMDLTLSITFSENKCVYPYFYAYTRRHYS